MNRSTGNLAAASAGAVLAVLVAMPAGSALADGGPSARLVQGGLGRALPGAVADVLNPAVEMPVATLDGAFRAVQGSASVRRAGNGSERSAVRFARGSLRTSGTALAFEGLVAECVAAADGTVRGATRLAGGRLVGGPALPARPSPGYRVPTRDGTSILLNRQVRTADGGMTVTGLVLERAPGGPREFGVARCDPVAGARAGRDGRAARPSRRAPVPAARPAVRTAAPAGRPVLGGVVGTPSAARVRPDLSAVAAPGALPLVPPSGLSGLFGGLPGLGSTGPNRLDGAVPTG